MGKKTEVTSSNNFQKKVLKELKCDINFTHQFSMHIIVFMTIVLGFASCASTLTKQEAMSNFMELSPKEGAEYYIANHIAYPFLDSLYNDSIMPAVLQCNYFDLDSVKNVLTGTSYVEVIAPVYQSKKEELKNQILDELDTICNNQCDIFKHHYMSALEMSIDSLLEEDISEIMNDYAGGFLNFRKLSFFFGRDRNDFKKMFWEKFDTLKYQNQIRMYVDNFFNTIKEQQNSYSMDLIGKPFNCNMSVSTPAFQVGLSQSTLSHIKEYTSKQVKEMKKEVLKDYVIPMAAAAASGGLATLYDIGNTAYDISKMLEDIDIDDDEFVKYVCEHDVSYQIRNFYLNKWIPEVFDEIKNSNKELYTHIINNL